MAQKPRKDRSPEPGNRPFSQLDSLMKKAGIGVHPQRKESEAVPAPRSPQVEAERGSDDDDQLFERAMESVGRISWRRDLVPKSLPPPVELEDSSLNDARLFQEAVSGASAPPIPEHPEYIEGWVGVAGRRFLPSLRDGMYSIQAYIDLHGLGRVEARVAVEEFVERMSRERSCCVKIVHGRGINSPSDRAILKDYLQRWLTTRRMSRHVVAYASAPYTDGGVGAVYVLLRRNPGSSDKSSRR